MTSRELSRRDVLAGFCAALALAFAPLDRFVAGLERFVRGILGDRKASREMEEALIRATEMVACSGGEPTHIYMNPRDYENILRETVGASEAARRMAVLRSEAA